MFYTRIASCRFITLHFIMCVVLTVYFTLTKDKISFRQIPALPRKVTEPGSRSGTEGCQPRSRAMYLKTHKTASTSVRTVIERYSDNHKLTVALPSGRDPNDFQYPDSFQTSFVLPLLPGETQYDTIFLHLRYNGLELKKIFPPEETLYFTVIREPGIHFESVFSFFYWIVPAFRENAKSFDHESMSEWLDKAEEYYEKAPHRYAKNGIFHDLGFDPKNESPSYIESAIQQVENDFDLVLVSDYFLESMVLLKDRMCWNLSDVATLRERSRTLVSSDTHQPVPEALRSKIRAWNKADAAIFDHFNRTFWKKIESFGASKMKKEVEILRNLNKDLTKTCAGSEPGKLTESKRVTKNKEKLEMFVYDWNKSANSMKECKVFVTSKYEQSEARNKKYQLKRNEMEKRQILVEKKKTG